MFISWLANTFLQNKRLCSGVERVQHSRTPRILIQLYIDIIQQQQLSIKIYGGLG